MADVEMLVKYFDELDLIHEEYGVDIWVVKREEEDPNLVIAYAPPLVILTLELMPVPDTENKEELYRVMLEMNATEMDHGAYAIQENRIILVDTLQVENLDVNELQASIDSLNLAASVNYKQLKKFRETE